jgi:hypothetical protein
MAQQICELMTSDPVNVLSALNRLPSFLTRTSDAMRRDVWIHNPLTHKWSVLRRKPNTRAS